MNYESICIKTCEVVKQTADFILGEWNRLKQDNVEIKGIHNFVTYVDKQSEIQLVEQFQKILPNSVFITEEETIAQNQGEFTWIIDPLDGTTNYIHHLSPVAISVALYHNQEPVVGIIYEIGQRECFYTWKGGKAFMNNRNISVSSSNSIKESLIATGFPYYDYSRINNMLQTLDYLFKNSHGVRRLGSAATDLAYVACGRFDAFYEYSLHAWDVAAGAFLVQQAGGRVCDFKGGNQYLFGKEIMASNDLVYNEFLNFISTKF
ncbi:MAG TPA: inositol monophosphatase family protein [Bacteroidales bacterium]|nr:inositol monophosphatase family protein [Bacteroidales bacterium]